MDRSGYAAATLAPRAGMRGAIPPRRKGPLRTMKDMDMVHSGSMGGYGSMQGHEMSGSQPEVRPAPQHGEHAGHGMPMPAPAKVEAPGYHKEMVKHGPDHHGPGNAMIAAMPTGRLDDPGTGLQDANWRVLVYTDLYRLEEDKNQSQPQHEIELHLTGNMERNMWSIDGKKFSEAPEPIPLRYGEKTRIVLVNDTMMDHPMHMHGMWMVLDNGSGAHNPYKHTILVKAGERAVVRRHAR